MACDVKKQKDLDGGVQVKKVGCVERLKIKSQSV